MTEKSEEEKNPPLLDPLVADKEFGCLHSIDDLKQTRQECNKLWCDICEKQRRSFATVKQGPVTTTQNTKATSAASSLNQDQVEYWSVDEYWRRFQNPKDDHQFSKILYKKYIISGIDLTACPVLNLSPPPPPLEKEETEEKDDEKEEEDKQKINFWDTIGSHITFLQFENCTFSGEQPELFEKLVTEKLPNLETLILSNNTTSPKRSFPVDERILNINRSSCTATAAKLNPAPAAYLSSTKRNEHLKTIEIAGQTPMCFYMLLLNSPNIEILKLDQDLNKEHDYSETMSEVFNITRCTVDRTPFQLKHLDVMGARFVQGWVSPKLPLLEHFTVTISPTRCGSKSDKQSSVPVILESANVRVWKVFHPPVFPACRSDRVFPSQLPTLKELYLFGNIVRDLDFLPLLPALEILHIDYHCYDKVKMMYNLFEDKMCVRKSYKPLKEYGRMITRCRKENEEPLENMQRCYLDISLEPRLIKIVAGWMPNLKSLEINLSADNELWAICKYLPNLEELGFLFDSRVDDSILTGLDGKKKERHAYNITAFKNLKKFQLKQRCHGIRKKYRLGSQSVYEGFLKMTTLQCVSICASEEMTLDAEVALKEHVASAEIIRNYDNSIPHGDGECCRVKFAETSLAAKRVTDE